MYAITINFGIRTTALYEIYIWNALRDERCFNKTNKFVIKCRHQNNLLLTILET